jgi:TM2 domain-containing membrane protein YozV
LSGEALQVCPYCRAGFEPDEAVTACPSCGTPHHADCFAENGGCTIFGCASAPAEEAKISVGASDFQPMPPVAPGSMYGLGAVGPPALPVPPPPPLPLGSAPPPPPLAVQPYGWQGYGVPAVPYDASYGYGNYVRPKSRVAFVLLAVFLGSFGAHNFYAGYTKKAVIQLCLTICTCFWASIVTWIWAIVEACTVMRDDDGVLLS